MYFRFVCLKLNRKSSKNPIEEPETNADQLENEVFAVQSSEHRSSESRKGQKRRRALKLFSIDKEAVNRKLTKVSTNIKIAFHPTGTGKDLLHKLDTASASVSTVRTNIELHSFIEFTLSSSSH